MRVGRAVVEALGVAKERDVALLAYRREDLANLGLDARVIGLTAVFDARERLGEGGRVFLDDEHVGGSM